MTQKPSELEQKIKDPSAEVRRRAVALLGTLPPEECEKLLLIALADEDWRVRKETVSVFSHISPTSTLLENTFHALIQESNIGLRNAAAEALVKMGDSVLTYLIAQLEPLAPNGKKIALEVIGRSRHSSALATLIDYLEDDDHNVRVCAAELLGEHSNQRAISALCAKLSNEDPLLTLAALQSLNQMGAQIAWKLLEPLSNEPIYDSEILLAMAKTGHPQAATIILNKIIEEPAAIRALDTLYLSSTEAADEIRRQLGNASTSLFDVLIQKTEEENSKEQRMAIRCLMLAKKEAHIPILTDLAQMEHLFPMILDGLEEWGQQAINGLESLLTKAQDRSLASAVNLLSRLISDEQGNDKSALFSAYLNSSNIIVATAAAGAIARFGDDSVVPRLISLTHSTDNRARRAAGHALSQVGLRYPESVRSAILAEEIEGQSGVELCRVLEVVGKPGDIQLLASSLNASEPDLRKAVINAIASIGGQDALEIISLGMMDEDTTVQIAVAGALARIGPAASETIVSALHGAKGPLRSALVKALGQVGHPEAEAILRPMYKDTSHVAMAALEAMQLLNIDPTGIQNEILHHDDAEVVKMALSILGTKVSQTELFKLLSHPAWDVRLAAVEKLYNAIGDPLVVKQLQNRLAEDEDDLVCLAITRLLDTTGK